MRPPTFTARLYAALCRTGCLRSLPNYLKPTQINKGGYIVRVFPRIFIFDGSNVLFKIYFSFWVFTQSVGKKDTLHSGFLPRTGIQNTLLALWVFTQTFYKVYHTSLFKRDRTVSRRCKIASIFAVAAVVISPQIAASCRDGRQEHLSRAGLH